MSIHCPLTGQWLCKCGASDQYLDTVAFMPGNPAWGRFKSDSVKCRLTIDPRAYPHAVLSFITPDGNEYGIDPKWIAVVRMHGVVVWRHSEDYRGN